MAGPTPTTLSSVQPSAWALNAAWLAARRNAGVAQISSLAMLITMILILLPITITSAVFAHRIEQRDPFAIWSNTRRTLFGVLAGATAFVGLSRLLAYTYSVVASLLGVGAPLSGGQLVQVLVTLSIAGPLFAWAVVQWRRSNVAKRALNAAAVAVIILVLMALWTLSTGMLVRRQPATLVRPRIIALDVAAALVVSMADAIVYDGTHPQSFGSAWPVAAVLSVGAITGMVSGGIVGALTGLASRVPLRCPTTPMAAGSP